MAQKSVWPFSFFRPMLMPVDGPVGAGFLDVRVHDGHAVEDHGDLLAPVLSSRFHSPTGLRYPRLRHGAIHVSMGLPGLDVL